MIDRKLFNYSIGYLKNVISSNLYECFGINISKPAVISILLTWKCNSRCLMCDYWKRTEHHEMSKQHWLKFLTELKKWHKNAHVQFSGGEPLVKKNSIELFEHCSGIGLSYGITTNLTIAPHGGMKRLVSANPFNINVSLDGIKAETHDYSRGVKGTFTKVMKNLESLLEEMSGQNKQIRVIIKPTVFNINLDELEGLVEFAKNKGLVGVNFQPIFKWSKTLSENLWVTDIDKVEKVAVNLVKMKKRGYPVLTSEKDLLSWGSYFRGETKKRQNRGKCIVGIRNFDVLPNGDVFLCRTIKGVIGNLNVDNPSAIWHSDSADHERNRILQCKKLCLTSCQTKRTIKELVWTFLKMSQSKLK